ncbi:MAG: hypothetical protein ACK5O8_17815 [Pirellula sp.]
MQHLSIKFPFGSRVQSFIVPITTLLLACALITSLAWLVKTHEYEPFITMLSLLAAITGLIIDRWLGEREQRYRLLRSLGHELYMNLGVLNDVDSLSKTKEKKVIIFPRFYNSVLNSVIATGVFSSKKDEKLWNLLHGWMSRSIVANTRLQASEIYLLQNPASAAGFHEKMYTGKVMEETRKALIELANLFITEYSHESGIDINTVLFPNHLQLPEENQASLTL